MIEPDTIAHLVEAATRAPSSHNTQPWVFRTGGSEIELLADRTRALPANDPDDRELTISCGCALMALRIAAARDGLGTDVTLLPDSDDPDLLARVALTTTPEPGLAALFPLIAQRQTYRKSFDGRDVPADSLKTLLDAAAEEGAWLDPLDTAEARQAAAELVAEGDAAQWGDPAWRRELAAWMHPRRRGDGLTLPWLAVPVAQMVVRSFDMGNGVAARDEALAEHSPLLAVLGTGRDGPHDWMIAGQALQRVLLAAVAAGLQASYLNQPAQVPRLRPRLQALTAKGGHPQVLLRMGYPEEILPATPRRPVEAVTEPVGAPDGD